MLMHSPYSRKPVEVPSGLVDRFRGAGFIEKEPEVVAVVEEPDVAPLRKRRTSRSS